MDKFKKFVELLHKIILSIVRVLYIYKNMQKIKFA